MHGRIGGPCDLAPVNVSISSAWVQLISIFRRNIFFDSLRYEHDTTFIPPGNSERRVPESGACLDRHGR